MQSLALARRIARPSLVLPALSIARWYAATAAAQANFSTDGEQLIHQKLTEKFKPSELRVEDVSGTSCINHLVGGALEEAMYRWMWDLLQHHHR